jgi:hypothetical protein
MNARLQIVNLFIMQIFPSSTHFLPSNSNVFRSLLLDVNVLSSWREVVYNNG